MTGGMEMSVCEKGHGAGSVANWRAESFFTNIVTHPVICL